jgi:hypothetical protein
MTLASKTREAVKIKFSENIGVPEKAVVGDISVVSASKILEKDNLGVGEKPVE